MSEESKTPELLKYIIAVKTAKEEQKATEVNNIVVYFGTYLAPFRSAQESDLPKAARVLHSVIRELDGYCNSQDTQIAGIARQARNFLFQNFSAVIQRIDQRTATLEFKTDCMGAPVSVCDAFIDLLVSVSQSEILETRTMADNALQKILNFILKNNIENNPG